MQFNDSIIKIPFQHMLSAPSVVNAGACKFNAQSYDTHLISISTSCELHLEEIGEILYIHGWIIRHGKYIVHSIRTFRHFVDFRNVES